MSDSEDHAEDLSQDGLPTVDPYEVLVLERSATADQIKSAYRKLALKHHPGKNSAVLSPFLFFKCPYLRVTELMI